MAEVLGLARGLLDPNEERNQADPYVIALAYELRERFPGVRVCVATENTRDRPPLQSPGTACEMLGIERLDFQHFLDWLPDVDEEGAPLVDEPTLLDDGWALDDEEQTDAERVAAERHDLDDA